MMKKYLMTLAAFLCCTMTTVVFTACTDNIDNPTVPAEEPEAVDNGKWHVTEEIMDKSVRPGDDFFMYCVGGYWNNTVLDETNPMKLLFLQQIIDEMQKLEATLTLPSKEKTLADADKNDAAAIKAQKAVLQSAIDRVDALTTKDTECYRPCGRPHYQGRGMETDGRTVYGRLSYPSATGSLLQKRKNGRRAGFWFWL